MDQPLFLTEDTVYGLHVRSLELFGGTPGLRDRTLVQSALGAALNTFHYGAGDLSDIAATYAFHIAQAQAFLDGNKRTAVAVSLVFLDLNGQTRRSNDLEIYDALIAVAEKRMEKAGLAELFRRAASPVA